MMPKISARSAVPARKTARRAAAVSAAAAARAQSPASAARRLRACQPAGETARAAAGNSRTSAPSRARRRRGPRRIYAPRRRFSSTVSSTNVPRPSGTWATPRCTISSVGLPSIRSPPNDLTAGAHHAADRPQRGRLAGAVRAEQRGDAALFHREVDAMQNARLAIAACSESPQEAPACCTSLSRRGRRGSPRARCVLRRACRRRSSARIPAPPPCAETRITRFI